MHFIMRLNNFVYRDLSTNNKNRGSFISEYFQYFQMVSLELKSFSHESHFFIWSTLSFNRKSDVKEIATQSARQIVR